MTLNDYQKKSRVTAIYPNIGHNLIYPTLGLCGEAGEVAEKIKKMIRDDHGVMSPAKIKELKKEVGDVLWYIAAIASELGADLDNIAQENIDKLLSRQTRNQLTGSGDNR